MAERNYQFRQRLLDVHKKNRRDFSVKAKERQLTFHGGWQVAVKGKGDVILDTAAKDLVEYFDVSMGEQLKFARLSPTDGLHNTILYGIDPTLEEHAYRITVTGNFVHIEGADAAAAMQGGFWLEDGMNLNKAPVLDIGSVIRKPMYSPRMIHAGYGLDMFPDQHIAAIAHNGIQALLVFVKDVDLTPYGYLDFNDLIFRAGKYGVKVYAYSYMLSEKHPDDPEAEAFYENQYGRLFARCPGLAGVIFVGESCEFPSKDPHTTGMLNQYNRNPDGSKKIKDKVSPGWYPCCDFPAWLSLIKKIIRSKNPNADIVFWTYNWGWAPKEERLALIRTLPEDISLLVTFEMFENLIINGVPCRTVDYSLYFEGPGQYFVSEAEEAKKRGIRLYSMTNTGGLTWDIEVIPYEPMPQRWMARWDEMEKAHDHFGLCGLMDSHHFGFYPSIISELAKWRFSYPKTDPHDMLRKLVVRDWGEENADNVVEALNEMSEGLKTFATTNIDQYGPCRVGPTYPFLLFDNLDVEFPSPPYAHFGGNKITQPLYGYSPYTKPLSCQIDRQSQRELLEKQARFLFEPSLAHYQRALEMLSPLPNTLPPAMQEEAKRLVGLVHFIRNTTRTVIGIKYWAVQRQYLIDAKADPALIDKIPDIASRMMQLALAEKENALDTIPLVEFDSRLGFEPSMEYMCDKAHLEWKLNLLEHTIQTELPLYLK